MFSALRRRMTYANVAMTVALVFAMTGGAYAAKKYLITSTKQISPKVLGQLKGKAGANGAPGAAGPAGPQGPAGANGKDGAPGANGKDGVSVTSAALPKGNAKCKEGGSEFTAANGATTACNGKEGSPWTAGGTLPSKATETGEWAFGPVTEAATGGVPVVQVEVASFSIPLAAPLDATHVHYINPSGEEVSGNIFAPTTQPPGPACEGSVVAPTAESGNLCIYAKNEETQGASGDIFDPSLGTEGASTSGAFTLFKIPTGGAAKGYGTWAVTG